MKTSLIKIKIGDKVQEKESGKIGILKDIIVCPNGINNPELVTLLYVHFKDQDRMVESSSDKWTPLETETYEVFYPSTHLHKLCDEIIENNS